MHVLLVHRLDQQTYRLYHDHRVGGLDADDDIAELLTLEDAKKLHAALHNACGGVAIARHDAVGQGTVVDAYANSRMVLLAYINKRYELACYLVQLGGILLVGIFQVLEGTPGVDVVAGVDTHLLTVLGSHVGHMGCEVHIGHQRRLIAVSLQTG